jgi:hypothetical protein
MFTTAELVAADVPAEPTQARSLNVYGLDGSGMRLSTTGAVYRRQTPAPYANEEQPCSLMQRLEQPVEVTSVGSWLT